MVDELNERILAALDREYPLGIWDVLPGQFTPRQPDVCQSYAGVVAAHRALLAAGYAVTSKYVPLPPVHAYDMRTALRYQKEDTILLVLLRRLTESLELS